LEDRLVKCTEMLDSMPSDYVEEDYLDQIKNMGGLSVPLNVFLMQEVQLLQVVIARVRSMMTIMQQAIRGEVVITGTILEAISAVYDARVPGNWVHSVGGDEISWQSSTLGLWYAGLGLRDDQLREWLAEGPQPAYWLTGFFNAQGFLTSVQQEVTRAHLADKWSLDSVVTHTEVTDVSEVHEVKGIPSNEGAMIFGLSLDGAAWSTTEKTLVESEPKTLFCALPVMLITAVTKAQMKGMVDVANVSYECPVYKYPQRTDLFFIFKVNLKCQANYTPVHWALRGVALLCNTE